MARVSTFAAGCDRDVRLVLGGDGRDDRDHVDHEREGVAGADQLAASLVAVSELGGDVELQLLAGSDPDEPLVPSLDHARRAERGHRDRRTGVVAVVEHLARPPNARRRSRR